MATLVGSFLFSYFLKPSGTLQEELDKKISTDSYVWAATTTVRWAGYTTTTFDGSMWKGGTPSSIKTGNIWCNAAYSGSVWADAEELVKLGASYPWTQSVWLADVTYALETSCFHYQSNSASYTGSFADGNTLYAGGAVNSPACSNSYYLPCVYTP